MGINNLNIRGSRHIHNQLKDSRINGSCRYDNLITDVKITQDSCPKGYIEALSENGKHDIAVYGDESKGFKLCYRRIDPVSCDLKKKIITDLNFKSYMGEQLELCSKKKEIRKDIKGITDIKLTTWQKSKGFLSGTQWDTPDNQRCDDINYKLVKNTNICWK